MYHYNYLLGIIIWLIQKNVIDSVITVAMSPCVSRLLLWGSAILTTIRPATIGLQKNFSDG